MRIEDDTRLQGDAVEAPFVCQGHRRLTLLVLSWGSEATQCSFTRFPSKLRVKRQALRDSCTKEALGNIYPTIWSLCTTSDGHNMPKDSGATLPLASFLSSIETQVPPYLILKHVAEIPPVQSLAIIILLY